MAVSTMAVEASRLQALVQQSRDEQALISQKILALRSTLDEPWGRTKVGGAGAFPLVPAVAPKDDVNSFGSTAEEIVALRERVVELDSTLMEREAETQELRARVMQMQETLRRAYDEPQHSLMWQNKYESTHLQNQAFEKKIEDIKHDESTRIREMQLLTAYSKQMQTEYHADDLLRSQMRADGITKRETLQNCNDDVAHLDDQVELLREGFIRCLARVTQSLVAGIVTVHINGMAPSTAFAVLRRASDREHIMEFFDQPESMWEYEVLDLSQESGATVTADMLKMEINIRSPVASQSTRLVLATREEYVKWTGAFHILKLLPSKELNAARKKQADRVGKPRGFFE